MKKLTPTHEVNEFAVERMVGKAMCAYANYTMMTDKREYYIEQFNNSQIEYEKIHSGLLNEYEATVRCVEMLVDENIYQVQMTIIENAKEQFEL